VTLACSSSHLFVVVVVFLFLKKNIYIYIYIKGFAIVRARLTQSKQKLMYDSLPL
jgi:hypothetical protein